jgi:hypothetical protein
LTEKVISLCEVRLHPKQFEIALLHFIVVERQMVRTVPSNYDKSLEVTKAPLLESLPSRRWCSAAVLRKVRAGRRSTLRSVDCVAAVAAFAEGVRPAEDEEPREERCEGGEADDECDEAAVVATTAEKAATAFATFVRTI